MITPDKLRKFLPFLASPNVESLISNFNPNKFGEVNYAELIYSIKGNMTEKRQRMVDQVFQMLDSRQEG